MPRRTFWALIGILALGFALRVYELGASPLRGDEAYAVRYWAQTPAEVIRTQAAREPHPFGTFLSFYAWEQIAGASEFGMRMLSVLGNWLGTAAMVALAWRLFRDKRIALAAAALWAAHPFLLWHAQDARNYALWAGLSTLAMWALVRAAQRGRARDWAFYVAATCAALYIFFLEAFLLPLHALYLLLFHRQRRTWTRAGWAWVALAVLLIPWGVQAWFLSQSGYGGAILPASAERLVTWLWPTLLLGDAPATPWSWLALGAWAALVSAGLAVGAERTRRIGAWLAAWIALPTALLFAAATRMSVFHPRYVIAVTPALLLLTATAAVNAARHARKARAWALVPSGLALLPLLWLGVLIPYWRGERPKAPSWPALVAYLEARVQPDDLIVHTQPDPAFRYYYSGAAAEMSLTGNAVTAQLRAELNFYNTIWLVGRSAEAEAFLEARMQRVSFHTVADFPVMQFRAWEVRAEEIAQPLDVRFGEIARLRGYTLQGPGPTLNALTVLLYWQPLARAEADYKVFVHLTPANAPQDVLDQDDHRPLYGFASTLEWSPQTLYRDPYHLLEKAEEPLGAGVYTLRIGFYDPATGERLPVYDGDGNPLGDSLALAEVTFGARAP